MLYGKFTIYVIFLFFLTVLIFTSNQDFFVNRFAMYSFVPNR